LHGVDGWMGLAGDSSHRQAAAVSGTKTVQAYVYNANHTALASVEGWCMPRSHSFLELVQTPQTCKYKINGLQEHSYIISTLIALRDQSERLCCCSKI
jgi:hypothetical protein